MKSDLDMIVNFGWRARPLTSLSIDLILLSRALTYEVNSLSVGFEILSIGVKKTCYFLELKVMLTL